MKFNVYDLGTINEKPKISKRLSDAFVSKYLELVVILKTIFTYVINGKFLDFFNAQNRENFFLNWFGFGEGIRDSTSDYIILERRNKVIKRLMVVTNTFYFILVYQSGMEQLMHITLIITFLSLLMSNRIIKLMNNRDKSLIKEKIIQYLWSIYVLFISFAVYIKLKTASDSLTIEYIQSIIENGGTVAEMALSSVFESVSQVGYIVICYALSLIALYQDKKLLRNTYTLTIVGIVVMNFTILLTHDSHFIETPNDVLELFSTGMGRYIMLDIGYKIISMGIFMIVLYGIVVMNETLEKQRKREASKRNEIELEFISSIDEVFNVIEVFNQESTIENRNDIYRVGEMSKVLAGLAGLSRADQNNIYDFAVCHANKENLIELDRNSRILEREKDYKTITRRTKIGSEIIKRVQLNQKCEQVVQSYISNWEKCLLKKDLNKMDISDNIIFLVDIYDTLRGLRPYKANYGHQESVQFILDNIQDRFDPDIFQMFLKYNKDFDKIYISNTTKENK